MSAAMFSTPANQKLEKSPSESRIPVPASPTPFRRYGSVRGTGDSRRESLTKLDWAGGGAEQTGGRRPERGRSSLMDRAASRTARGAADGDGGSRARSLSLSLSTSRLNSPKSPSVPTVSPNKPVSPDTRNFSTGNLDYWDSESVTSIGSSVTSCEHATIARNGTTFSGRSMKYVFHCNQHSGATGEDYLTPTQRAHRQVKKLKYLLHQAKKDLEQKDSDILKLTKEVVELRLYKAALNSPEDKSQSNSSDAVTVKENASDQSTPEKDVADTSSPNARYSNELNHSFADSGNFEDGTNSSVHSKDSVLFEDLNRSPFKTKTVETAEIGVEVHLEAPSPSIERNQLIIEYERRIQELVKTHEEETHQLKQKHNDKVEELLQRITEINQRYWELVPELDSAKERIKDLEQRLEEAGKKLEEAEEKSKQTYADMYAQGQQAARLEHENAVMELARQNPTRVSVPELLQELQVTKNELDNIKAMYRQLMEAKSKNKIDPEITLQFLKSAFYYFLTDKENSQGHLKAIQSILGFSPTEITTIDKARQN